MVIIEYLLERKRNRFSMKNVIIKKELKKRFELKMKNSKKGEHFGANDIGATYEEFKKLLEIYNIPKGIEKNAINKKI